MSERPYIPERGFQIEGSTFAQHWIGCGKCSRYDKSRPSTLSLLCLDGAVLWKKDNAQQTERDPRPINEYHAPAKEIRKLMRYK